MCYLLHTGLCPQQHIDRQSAHCLSLGSVTVGAVSLILHSWRLKRGKNHQRSFLASPDITSAHRFFFFFLNSPRLQTSPERKDLLFCLHKVPLYLVILKLQLMPTLAKCCLLCKCGRNERKFPIFYFSSLLKSPSVWSIHVDAN